MSLDYWRDCNHRFYISYDGSYFLQTEDGQYKTYLVKDDVESLITCLTSISEELK